MRVRSKDGDVHPIHLYVTVVSVEAKVVLLRWFAIYIYIYILKRERESLALAS